MACEHCTKEFIELLQRRISKILELSDQDDGGQDAADAKCFHLMEMQRKLEGKPTAGLYD